MGILRKSIAATFLLAVFSISGVANSAIVYQSDDRFINHSLGGTYTPSTPFADFNDDWWAWEAGAFQNTSLTNTTMSGSGSTYAGSDASHYGAEATSTFSVTFSVDQLTDFSLTGSLDTNWVTGSLYVSLRENGSEIFGLSMWDLPHSGLNLFSSNGQFDTGNTYQLILNSYSWYSDYYDETWNFNLTTTSAVPVPAGMWLFGSGLIGLVGFAKRKKA